MPFSFVKENGWKKRRKKRRKSWVFHFSWTCTSCFFDKLNVNGNPRINFVKILCLFCLSSKNYVNLFKPQKKATHYQLSTINIYLLLFFNYLYICENQQHQHYDRFNLSQRLRRVNFRASIRAHDSGHPPSTLNASTRACMHVLTKLIHCCKTKWI